MINGHGDDIHRYNGKIKYNFSSNVYYKGCPPELLAAISSKVHTIENYPSPSAEELNEVAAKRFQLNKNQLLFTNGATEAFYLIAHMLSGRSAGIVAPTFAEYQDACKIHGLECRLIEFSTLGSQEFEVVFLCNPNNPDGTIIPTEVLLALIEKSPSTTFVIDEAYIEFTDQIESLAPMVNRFNNLMVVRSLTKAFAIPGIRLGYIIASSNSIGRLLAKKMPWSVNALAINAGLEVFKNYDTWLFPIEKLLEATREFVQQLSTIPWLKVKPSQTSYFLVELKKGTAASLKDYLANQHGILIRDATNFNRLEGQNIRLSTQSREANAALIEALQLWK